MNSRSDVAAHHVISNSRRRKKVEASASSDEEEANGDGQLAERLRLLRVMGINAQMKTRMGLNEQVWMRLYVEAGSKVVSKQIESHLQNMTLAAILMAAFSFTVFMSPSGDIKLTSNVGGVLCTLGIFSFTSFIFTSFMAIIFDNTLKFVHSESELVGLLSEYWWVLQAIRLGLFSGFFSTMIRMCHLSSDGRLESLGTHPDTSSSEPCHAQK